MAKVLIAGCGYVGTALGVLLADRGHEVWGVRRNAQGLPAAIRGISLDLNDAAALGALPESIEFLFYTAAPDASNEAAYRRVFIDALGNLLRSPSLRAGSLERVLFTSSTAVYAQHAGEAIDERSPAEPEHFSGRCLLEAERLVEACGVRAVSVRLGGIYGPGRARILESARSRQMTFGAADENVTNRIHRDDCAGALAHLMTLPNPRPIYIAVDHEPASRRSLLTWLAAELGLPVPTPAAEVETSERRARSNKRCLNTLLCESGYRFVYPTFREGYRALLSQPRNG